MDPEAVQKGRMSMGRKKPEEVKVLTYEEAINMLPYGDTGRLRIRYDGLESEGYWYEDYMMKKFAECKLVHEYGNVFKVHEWPKKGGMKRGKSSKV